MVGYFHIDNEEDRTSSRRLCTDMAVECHRMQGDMHPLTLLLSSYDHRHSLRGRRRYHGWMHLNSRHRVVVFSALLETPGCDSSAMLTAIVIRRVVVFLLWADIIKNHPQQLGPGSFQEPFRLHSHRTGTTLLRMHQEHAIHHRCQNHYIRNG